MPKEVKTGPSSAHAPASSFLSLVSGWVQQGFESFFATQRILVDVAMRQNASAMRTLREGLSDPEHSPAAIMTELAVEGTSSFIEAQRILLNLAQQENEIVMNGVKERVVGSKTAVAMTDVVRRSIETFIEMQQDFLKSTKKHTLEWLESAKDGKPYEGSHLVDLAREGMDKFVAAQKTFLDVIAQETNRMTKQDTAGKKVKKTELSELAREATNSFIDAQKKLLDLAGQQMNVNLKSATRVMEMMAPSRLLPVTNITGEGVKNFVEAEKALIETVMKPGNGTKAAAKAKRGKRARKGETAKAAHAGA
jgi:hypothetical protein